AQPSPTGSLYIQGVLDDTFFFIEPAAIEFYTLSLHDALPISARRRGSPCGRGSAAPTSNPRSACAKRSRRCVRSGCRCTCTWERSEEHTSELQSRRELVCRLLLEKKKADVESCRT